MLEAGLSCSVREWAHTGVKDVHTELCGDEVEVRCCTSGAVAVEFKGLGAQCCTHLGDKFAGALCGEQATGVFEINRVNIWTVRIRSSCCQELLIGVNGAGCVDNTGENIGDALFLGPTGNLNGLCNVIAWLGNHETAQAMASHDAKRHAIDRLFCLLPGHEPHSGGDAGEVSVGGCCTNTANALPGVLAVELGAHDQVGGAGEVQGVESHALIDGRHGLCHAGGDTGCCPETLVTVTNTRVNDLDGSLATLLAGEIHLRHCRLPFVLPRSVQTSWWGLLRQ